VHLLAARSSFRSPAISARELAHSTRTISEASLARETIYLVQAFSEKQGALRGDPPTRCKSEDAAKRAAVLLGETKAGAVASSSSGDADLGDFDDEPVVLAVVGRVPDAFGQ
jgi:hypothetical protein